MYNFVIAGRSTPDGLPSIWNFYPTELDAEATHVFESEKFQREYPAGSEVMSWDDFEKLQKTFWLDQPILEITSENWYDALGALPPLKWHTTPDGVELFLMSEFTSGNYTAQYAQFNDRYFVKTVDAFDPNTWMALSCLPL